MATSGGDWNSFLQSRQARLALYGVSVFFCLFYAFDSIVELLTPERAESMIQMMGATGYYAMTIIRFVVLLITGIGFGRMVVKTYQEKDE